MPLDPAPAESIASLAADPERFNAQREALRRYCFAILQNEADAEDAVQMTLERALRYQPAQRDSGRWLTAIARNVCRDLRSSAGPTPLPLDAVAEDWNPADPELQVTTRNSLECALGSLTPTERKAVGASWVLDRTSYDAARSVGLAHQTLRVHLARARKKLAVYLDDLERATAGLVPWFAQWPDRAGRRMSAALSRDAGLSDRLLVMTAPPLALAVTIASVAVLGTRAVHIGAQPTSALPAIASLDRPQAAGARAGGAAGLPAGATSGGQAGVVRGLLPAVSPGRQQDAYVSDVEPSPNYAQDHTLYASATDSACGGRAACGELFVSHDAGHSWTNIRSIGLQPFAQLLLPAGAYSNNTFYAFGSGGLQITTNGGRAFTTMISDLPGYAGLMPPGAGTFVSVANVDLWNFATAATPGLAGTYPPGTLAVGSAIAVPAAGGWSFLQPVQVPGQSERLLVCATGAPACALGATLPWSDRTTKLVASPDGTVVAALNASGLAVSRDGGATFEPVSMPYSAGATDLALTTVGPAVRIVLVPTAAHAVMFSDDFGSSWHQGVAAAAANASPRLIRNGVGASLILELSRANNDAELYGYSCSNNGGATWAAC